MDRLAQFVTAKGKGLRSSVDDWIWGGLNYVIDNWRACLVLCALFIILITMVDVPLVMALVMVVGAGFLQVPAMRAFVQWRMGRRQRAVCRR